MPFLRKLSRPYGDSYATRICGWSIAAHSADYHEKQHKRGCSHHA